jgi:hypothetical protein
MGADASSFRCAINRRSRVRTAAVASASITNRAIGLMRMKPSHDRASTLDDSNEHDSDSEEEQEVNEPAQRVGAHHPQHPQHQQNHEDGP